MWDVRTFRVMGFEPRSDSVMGWRLDMHHRLQPRAGKEGERHMSNDMIKSLTFNEIISYDMHLFLSAHFVRNR